MNRPTAVANLSIAPELPMLARTRSGIKFDPSADRWTFADAIKNVHLDFSRLPTTASFRRSVKLTLLWYAEHMSPAHLGNMYERLCHFLKSISAGRDDVIAEITSTDIINYRAMLSDMTKWYLGSLSGVLKKWHSLGYPGVRAEAVALLKQLRTPGNKKGEAILTHDPIYGPFTDIELESLQAALDRAYQAGEVDKEDFLLSYLFMLLGQRAAQYAALKVRDLVVVRAKDGTPIYTLRMPRAKQRNQPTRAEFKDRMLIARIGDLLAQHANEVRAAFQTLLPDPSDAPLFPARRRRVRELDGFAYHRTSDALSDLLESCLKSLGVTSERTGLPLHITATRFRRTVATRAAMEGHGELIIAELLDHTDTQNVGVYIEARPEIVERIDRAVAIHLAPMAQAFAGVLISSESEAIRAGDPASRVCDPRFDSSMKPLGNCGKHGFCGLLAPITCYTCVNFQPWQDGPHEAVLNHLLSERDRLSSRGDMRIASVNDRTILAVAEVVRQCEALRDEGGSKNG